MYAPVSVPLNMCLCVCDVDMCVCVCDVITLPGLQVSNAKTGDVFGNVTTREEVPSAHTAAVVPLLECCAGGSRFGCRSSSTRMLGLVRRTSCECRRDAQLLPLAPRSTHVRACSTSVPCSAGGGARTTNAIDHHAVPLTSGCFDLIHRVCVYMARKMPRVLCRAPYPSLYLSAHCFTVTAGARGRTGSRRSRPRWRAAAA